MVRFEANKTRDKDAWKFSRWIESREIRESIGKRVMMDLVLGKIAWMD